MDELNSMARDLKWGDRLSKAEDHLHPEKKGKSWVAWALLIAFLSGILVTFVVFYAKDPLSRWILGLLGF